MLIIIIAAVRPDRICIIIIYTHDDGEKITNKDAEFRVLSSATHIYTHTHIYWPAGRFQTQCADIIIYFIIYIYKYYASIKIIKLLILYRRPAFCARARCSYIIILFILIWRHNLIDYNTYNTHITRLCVYILHAVKDSSC